MGFGTRGKRIRESFTNRAYSSAGLRRAPRSADGPCRKTEVGFLHGLPDPEAAGFEAFPRVVRNRVSDTNIAIMDGGALLSGGVLDPIGNRGRVALTSTASRRIGASRGRGRGPLSTPRASHTPACVALLERRLPRGHGMIVFSQNSVLSRRKFPPSRALSPLTVSHLPTSRSATPCSLT